MPGWGFQLLAGDLPRYGRDSIVGQVRPGHQRRDQRHL